MAVLSSTKIQLRCEKLNFERRRYNTAERKKWVFSAIYGTLRNTIKHFFWNYGPEGQGFESLTACQKAGCPSGQPAFCIRRRDSNQVRTARWAVHEPVQTLANTLIFFRVSRKRKKMQANPLRRSNETRGTRGRFFRLGTPGI